MSGVIHIQTENWGETFVNLSSAVNHAETSGDLRRKINLTQNEAVKSRVFSTQNKAPEMHHGTKDQKLTFAAFDERSPQYILE